MQALDLARWQFGITTVYHFIFVPLTIGLTPLVAIMQTAWYRTGKDEWYRLTRFFSKLLLINFALGIVTGIVQEFQFGMNWSEYSRVAGDIFGAPLAMEALAAFFIESTFLGIWIFGWGRLSRGVHLLSIWLVAIATNLSAFFILAANSFMQYPVGAQFDAAAQRAHLDSLTDVLFSKLSMSTLWHTISTAFLVSGTFVAGVAVWWVVKSVRAGKEEQAKVYRKAGAFGCWVIVVAGLSIGLSGHHQAQIMVEVQPTKMAAAEMLCVTPENEGVGFTVAAFGACKFDENTGQFIDEGVTRIIEIPKMLSILAHGTPLKPLDGGDQPVMGADKAAAALDAAYAEAGATVEANPSKFIPNQMAIFWTFRLMIAFALFSGVLAVIGLLALRGGRVSGSSGLKAWAALSLPMPFIGAAMGWIFTEIGRQPFIVYPRWDVLPEAGGWPAPDVGLSLQTGMANSPVVTGGTVALSMTVYTLLYLTLAVAWFYLMKRYVAKGAPFEEAVIEEKSDLDDSKPLTFSY